MNHGCDTSSALYIRVILPQLGCLNPVC